MKNRKRIFVTTGLITILFLVLSALMLPLTSCNGQLLDRILANKIVFHGQVLDLDGNPVPNAKITYSGFSAAHYENAWTGGGPPNKIKHADENGRFEIRETGGSLFVNCTHPEYYETRDHPEESQRKFSYGFHVGEEPAFESKNPAIFRLRKKGIREPLYYSCSEMVNKGSPLTKISDGECIAIDVAHGKIKETKTSIYISYKCNNSNRHGGNSDWEFKLHIPGGGFVEKQKDFDFIAPEDGYNETVKIRAQKRHHYFVKFSNGLYGIFEIYVAPGNESCFTFDALVNPKFASRHLEYTRQKQINKTSFGHFYRPY